MFIYVVLAIIYAILCIANIKKSRAYIEYFFDKIIIINAIAFVLGVAIDVAGYDDSWLYNQMIEFVAISVIASPFLIARRIYKEQKNKSSAETAVKKEADVKVPEFEAGRKNLVKKFSDKNSLNLTEEQIDTIVKSSYASEEWFKELEAMNKDYKTIESWYKSDTDWLRVYLKAFNVQNISSDFEFQKSICIDNFNRVFSEGYTDRFIDSSEFIKAINQKFMTNFDDITFMKAYRFLQRNGFDYKLPIGDVVSVDNELDKLKKKYEDM